MHIYAGNHIARPGAGAYNATRPEHPLQLKATRRLGLKLQLLSWQSVSQWQAKFEVATARCIAAHFAVGSRLDPNELLASKEGSWFAYLLGQGRLTFLVAHSLKNLCAHTTGRDTKRPLNQTEIQTALSRFLGRRPQCWKWSLAKNPPNQA